MPSILFVCTANQFRSPLAAACLLDLIQRDHPPGEWRVESAGTWATPGLPAAAIALQAAGPLGIRGLESHVSRPVSQELLDEFDLILVMEHGHLEGISSEFPNAVGRLMLLSEAADGALYGIPDPFEGEIDSAQAAAELQALIQKGCGRILELAQARHDGRHTIGEANL